MKKILVITSGGDAPGMNAAIRAIVRTSYFLGISVFGSPSGYQGLVEQNIIPLKPETVANCIQHGGTILKADRSDDFFKQATRDTCRLFLKKQEIDGIIVIGGNGTFKGALNLSKEGGPPTIGIPGTIDNDIVGTDYTIGFDTARNTALQAIDKIRDTASSHNRNFLVEVMGRDSGFLAVDVGIAGGAEFILIPEIPTSIATLAERLTAPKRHKLSSIIVVAEAAEPGRSIRIANELEKLTNLPFRVCILGHTQRGGSPTVMDRKIASEMGFIAVTSLKNGQKNRMITLNNNTFELKDFPSIESTPRIFAQKELLEINDILCT